VIKNAWGNVCDKEKERSSTDKNDDCDSNSGETEVIGSNIYFYEDITPKSILNLTKALKELENTFIQEKIQRNQLFISPINLNIMSQGGMLLPALSVLDTILNCKAPVHTYIDGYCASAATFLSVVGKRRFIKKHSMMLIHQLTAATWGKYADIKDDVKNFDLWMFLIKDVYQKYTKVPTRKLNEILKHDMWWDAETCLKYGLVDEIL
jgi:ATP-dependent protease ClpP protease subunit